MKILAVMTLKLVGISLSLIALATVYSCGGDPGVDRPTTPTQGEPGVDQPTTPPQDEPIQTSGSDCAIQLNLSIGGQEQAVTRNMGDSPTFAATATNTSDEPVVLEYEIFCGHDAVVWTGFGENSLDTSSHCVAGVCVESSVVTSRTVEPGQSVDIYRGRITMGREACYEIGPGEYDVGFLANFREPGLICEQSHTVHLTVAPAQ